MIGDRISKILFFYYSLPSPSAAEPLCSIHSYILHLLRILSSQYRHRHIQNSILLSEDITEIIPLNNAALLEIRPFFSPIPVCALLRASEDLLRRVIPGFGVQASYLYAQQFFKTCGMAPSSWREFLLLQSFIRHLLQCGQAPTVFHPLPLAFTFPRDPFLVHQETFFNKIFIDYQSWEISLFRREYLKLDSSWMSGRIRGDMSSSQSLSFVIFMCFFTIRELFISENDERVQAFCLQFSHACIDLLLDRLSIFEHPSLVSCLIDEFFRFSGLLYETFSSNSIPMKRKVIFAHFLNNDLSFFFKVYSFQEWNLRNQIRSHQDLDLCTTFLNAYSIEGRSRDFPWMQEENSKILRSLVPIFSGIFSYWLTACHKKILPFVQAHNHLYLFTSTKEMFLAPLAAFIILDQGKALSDEQACICLSRLLRDDEETRPECRIQSFITMRALFEKYHSAERVKICIKDNVLTLKDYVNTSRDDQARSCFLSILHMTPYCEYSFISFHRMRLTIKLLIHALIQSGSSTHLFSQEFLLDRLMLLFSMSACNLLQILPLFSFWKQVLQLFSHKENNPREASLKKLYETKKDCLL